MFYVGQVCFVFKKTLILNIDLNFDYGILCNWKLAWIKCYFVHIEVMWREKERERGGDWMYSYLKHVCYKMKIKKPVFVCDNIKSMTRSVYDFLPELKESFI